MPGFCIPFAQESSKVYSISMEGKYLQVLVSMFRSGSSTSDFYKITKDSHYDFEADSNQNNHLSGRNVGQNEINTARGKSKKN